MTSKSKRPSLLTELKTRAKWLSAYARNVTSQTGEDGIIEKALSLLPAQAQWGVEFGAWDGRHLSNTFNLVSEHDYQVVLIEGDIKRYEHLAANYPYRDRVYPIHQYVSPVGSNSLDAILKTTPIPPDFDVLSIDIDGNDYHVWRSLVGYKPKLVVIEYNPTMSNDLDYVQPVEPNCNRGTSPRSIVDLATAKGYELIAATDLNLIFVDEQYFELFDIPDNDLSLIRDDTGVPQIFCGYDGRVMLSGKRPGQIDLPWHGIRLKEHSIQMLPPWLREYPGGYSWIQKFAVRALRLWTEPKAMTVRAIKHLQVRSASSR